MTIKPPKEMLKAANSACSKEIQRLYPTALIGYAVVDAMCISEKVVEAVLLWQKRNWECAPNAERMSDPWYSNSLKKWQEFSKQWTYPAKISFVDMLIFFGNRFSEKYDAPEPEVSEEITQVVADAIKNAHNEYHPTQIDYREMASAAIKAYKESKEK